MSDRIVVYCKNCQSKAVSTTDRPTICYHCGSKMKKKGGSVQAKGLHEFLNGCVNKIK